MTVTKRERHLRMALALLLVGIGVAVASLHAVVPMWVEGMPAYLDQLAGAIGKPCAVPSGAVRVGAHYLPLGISAYQGPLMTYLDIPAAYAWYSGLTDDMYVYRYKGIALLVVSAFLLFAVLRRFVGATPAFLSALVFATLPINVACSIVDLQYHTALGFGIVCAAAGFVRYLETGREGWFWATAALAGLVLWTRAEALIWPVAALVAFGVLFRRREITTWWRTTQRKGRLLAISVAAFLVGAAPVVAFNVVYPRSGLVAFLSGGAGGGMDVSRYLRIRLSEFVDFNLLNNWGLYSLQSRYWVFLAAFAVSAAGVVAAWVARRRVTFPLFALAVVVPLSVVSNGGPREIHLLPLALLVVAVIAEAAAAVPARLRSFGIALLGLILVANVAVCRSDLADWKRNATVGDTLLNHSDPALLAARLETYRDDAIYFTNIGLYQEAVWGSRGRLCGEGILFWGDDRGFVHAVERALTSQARRRVFVSFPAVREKRIPGRALARTLLLTQTLGASGVRWSSEIVSMPGVGPRYELLVVEPGEMSAMPVESSPPRLQSGGINRPSGGTVTGWVTGTGFTTTDVVLMDDDTPLATVFGNAGWLTFSVDEARVAGLRALNVKVVRPATGARSQELTLERP